MRNFGKWLKEKNPQAMNELADGMAGAHGGGEEEDPVDPKSGVKLSAKMEKYLAKLIRAMDDQKLSKKKQVEVFTRVLQALQGGGMSNTTGLTTARGELK